MVRHSQEQEIHRLMLKLSYTASWPSMDCWVTVCQNSTDILLLWEYFLANFGSLIHSLNQQVFIACARNCWVKVEVCKQTVLVTMS